MNKLNKEQIESINKLFKEGKGFKELGILFKVSPQSIRYHILDSKEKKLYNQKRTEYFNKLPLEVRQKKYIKQRETQKNYRRKRYKEDEVFRNKVKEYNKLRQRKKDE